MTETNAKIHVLADETLGGIKREYVEVDREVENGDTVLVTKMDGKDVCQIAKVIDNDFAGDSSYETLQIDRAINGEDLVNMLFDSEDEFVLLDPTDIVHIDGERYKMVEREAKVGEKIIVVRPDEGLGNDKEAGIVGIVSSLYSAGDVGVKDFGFVLGTEYRVLVPVESAEDEPQPADPIDVIASLAQEVAYLKRTVDRHRDEIDTLHKDNRTLGEELARLKNPVESESTIESAPFVLVIHEGRGEFDVYRRGKKIENISRLEIEADSRIGSSIDLEFNNVGVRP
ncbi:hypothetical protein [Bacillus amyloliquefaciens]|uniref:hypothetical protein n=1 Tax=Bacillus amyloliquefaciens TaxID=1390 RepID=UPI000B42E792|nr:hypothetical protein [Bacillus amyloliquefaciens]ARW40260.1 hypothetical protein S101267_03200 [Bacillus amyloliquefaciens]